MTLTVGQILWGLGILAVLALGYALWRALRRPDAYIYVPEGVALAEWQYKQLPMHHCAFCGREVSLQRHHLVPQSACPERKNDPTNLIVLCGARTGGAGGCHQVIGHKNNFKKFNPYVAEICEKYGGPPVDSREWRKQHEQETAK